MNADMERKRELFENYEVALAHLDNAAERLVRQSRKRSIHRCVGEIFEAATELRKSGCTLDWQADIADILSGTGWSFRNGLAQYCGETRAWKYLVSEGWPHCFVGSQESLTQWVLDLGTRKLVCGFLRYGARWESLDGFELLDLQEDIENNVLREIDHGPFDAEYIRLIETNSLPDWALDDVKIPANERHLDPAGALPNSLGYFLYQQAH